MKCCTWFDNSPYNDPTMPKYTCHNSDSTHWQYCERHHLPYISLANYDGEHSTLFYDITHLRCDHAAIAEDVRRIAAAYAELFAIPAHIQDEFAGQTYPFTLPLRREHAPHAAAALFDYLQRRCQTA